MRESARCLQPQGIERRLRNFVLAAEGQTPSNCHIGLYFAKIVNIL